MRLEMDLKRFEIDVRHEMYAMYFSFLVLIIN